MHQVSSRRATAVALLGAIALVGCTKDVRPATANWEALYGAMVRTAAGLHNQFNTINLAVKQFPPFPPGDATGQALMAKVNDALAAESSQLDELDGIIQSSFVSVHEALRSYNVEKIEAATEEAKVAFRAQALKVGTSLTAFGVLTSRLRVHQAELASGSMTTGFKLDFTDIDFKAGKAEFLFDRPHTQATLDKLLAYVNSCPELTVDIVGHTSNEGTAAVNQKLSVDRATAVRKWLEGKGVAASKIHAVSGVGATVNVVPEPPPNSAEAKAMAPAALEELRRKNRRITVEVVTPCGAH